MIKTYLLLLFISSTLYALPLKLRSIKFLDSNLEISGITKSENGDIIIVSDNNEDQYLYKVSSKDSRSLTTISFAKLSEFHGFFQYYYKSLLGYAGGRWLKSAWDLEGLYRCGSDYYVVNEQVREVLKLDLTSQKLSKIELDLTQAFRDIGTPLSNISNNAGFEGLAINCETFDLYIAQERDPRAIIIFNLKTLEYKGIIQTSSKEKSTISLDYSDLYLYKGFLYVLERNEWRILKIDITSKKVIDTFSFDENSIMNLRKFYKTDKPYGLAEALYIDDKDIIIGIDNNNSPISKRAEILMNFSGNYSSILYFDRPDNF